MDYRFAFKRIVFFASAFLLLSCKQNSRDHRIDESAFIFETSNIKGEESDYSRPAIITGHISHWDVYPNTKEISITIPFYDRVSSKQTSMIYADSFAFSLIPYAPRTISMPPYIDQLMGCPGDSIHIELDFSNLAKVEYSGRGADNNEKFNDFYMGYYLKDWPSHLQAPTAASFAEAAKQRLESHLDRLQDFISDKQPSPELIALCRKVIEADYYSSLIQGLLAYKFLQGEEIAGMFKTEDAEPLFHADCFNSNLFELSSNIRIWEFRSMDPKEVLRLANDYASLVSFLRKSTKNDLLFQMMVSDFYNQLLEANDVDRFEEYFDSFNENVTYPLLKLSTRDRYVVKKAYQQNAKSLSDAILHADKPRDVQLVAVKENEGLKLLRSIINQEERKVIYLCIGAAWCPGGSQELPYQLKMAEKYRGKPLRIVNFYLDDEPDDLDSITHGIENFHLTDAQRAGLDPILHLGRGIPFYILIDKEGVIVDFGEHLRPSHPETSVKIDQYLENNGS